MEKVHKSIRNLPTIFCSTMLMLCSQLFSFSPTCSLLFVTVRYCSSLFVTVRHCSLQFRTVFFSKFLCNFTFVEKIIKFYNFVYCRVRHRFFVFRTSCDHDDEKLPLKYIVERTRFYVSLKLEKNSDELFGGKKISH